MAPLWLRCGPAVTPLWPCPPSALDLARSPVACIRPLRTPSPTCTCTRRVWRGVTLPYLTVHHLTAPWYAEYSEEPEAFVYEEHLARETMSLRKCAERCLLTLADTRECRQQVQQAGEGHQGDQAASTAVLAGASARSAARRADRVDARERVDEGRVRDLRERLRALRQSTELMRRAYSPYA